MAMAVSYGIARTVVARGDAHCDAEIRGLLQGLVHLSHRLRGPNVCVLRISPTNRQNAWVILLILRSGIHGDDPPLFAPIGEIEDDCRLWTNTGHNLDVQHHFTLCTIFG